MNRFSLSVSSAIGAFLGLYMGFKNWDPENSQELLLVILLIVSAIVGLSLMIAWLRDSKLSVSDRIKRILTFMVSIVIIYFGSALITQHFQNKRLEQSAREVVSAIESYRNSSGVYPENLQQTIEHPAVWGMIYSSTNSNAYKMAYSAGISLFFTGEHYFQVYSSESSEWTKTNNDLAVFED